MVGLGCVAAVSHGGKPWMAQIHDALQSIGKAVINAQGFEAAIIPIFEVHRIFADPGRMDSTGGRLPEGAWKQPIASLIRQLVERSKISGKLEDRLRNYVEDRHLLIHRWAYEVGIPSTDDEWAKVRIHADHVAAEALELMNLFVSYALRYGNPETSTCAPEEFGIRMSEIFLTIDSTQP
jgi:hypothetical protein